MGFFLLLQFLILIISRGAEGPGREILQRPSVRPSVTFSFRTVTQKRMD